MPKTIKLSQLGEACYQQRTLFKEKFGDEVKVSVALARRVAKDFNWVWAANHLLSAPAWAEYKKVRGLGWADYEKVRDLAWADYKKACDPARADYNKVCAVAFVKAYLTG